jgi:hypothetical protein
MSLAYVMTRIPRLQGANVYKLKSNSKGYPMIYQQYDEMSQEYLQLVEGAALLLGFNLRYGDIVIDESIAGTISPKRIPRNGIFIFDSKHLQYLDRTLNGSGTIPNNFPSFTIFPIGFWKDIFIDNVLWIEPPPSYKILNNKIITNLYTIITTPNAMSTLLNLMTGDKNIIMHIPKLDQNIIYFDLNLYEIYIHRKKNGI